MKSEERNDSLDTFIRQAIGKEPLLPFSRTADSPVQWIQLLHALDHPDLPGWPLLTPLKVQMQKCEKCSKEFCSPINYRRHIRVHRRSLNVNKEYHKSRDLLAAFWDKLSFEKVKEVVSFNNVMLKEIPGTSVIRALASSLRKPAVWTLPQVYVKSGSALLDVIQAKPSRLPISSQELFSILDDASERTFLCAGTAESLQKYVFDGETAKNSLELKNLVASASFLFEQQLVKAWVADKDAEALRCHMLLVEEEDAAHKRQAAVLERKKLKKLQLKEQKVKEQFDAYNADSDAAGDAADTPDSSEALWPSHTSDSNSSDVLTNLYSCLELLPLQNKASDGIEAQCNSSSEHLNQEDSQTIELQRVDAKGHRHMGNNHRQVPKLQRGGQHGFHLTQNLQTSKSNALHKLNSVKDRSLLNGSKIWTKKLEVNSEGGNLKVPLVQAGNSHETDENNCKVMIGSISVTIKSHIAQQQDNFPAEVHETYNTEHTIFRKKKVSERLIKPNAVPSGNKQKLWRPVSRGEAKSISVIERSSEESEDVAMSKIVHERMLHSETSVPSPSVATVAAADGDNQKQYYVLSDNAGNLPFSSVAVKEFLERRWKEAISSDHVKLVLSSGRGPSGCSDLYHGSSVAASDISNINETIGDHTEKQSGSSSSQVQFRKRPEKNVKFRYMPKQKQNV